MLKDGIEKKKNQFKIKNLKKQKLNRTNSWNSWPWSWDQNYLIEGKHEKNRESKFLIVQNLKIKQIAIKTVGTKLDIKTKWKK
jgi:hypothetical protein